MYRLLPLVAVVALAAGCSGQRVVPVSGRVTLNGQPLANVHVSFQPISSGSNHDAGSGSYAITDNDGRYTLKLVHGDTAGAVVGKHRVEITPRNTDDDADRRGKGAVTGVPARYNRNSELTFDVTGGTDKADFPLTSP
jgi:hypothetical protein